MQIVKEQQPFERVVVSREEALAMFQENKFKAEIIGGLPEQATISLYRCGPMVDLCHGPHLPNTGLLRAAAVATMNRAFWRADVNKEPLQARLSFQTLDCCSPGTLINFFTASNYHVKEFSKTSCNLLCEACKLSCRRQANV